MKMAHLFQPQPTALHQGLSKYATAKDTYVTPTLTEHNKTLARLGTLLSLQPRSKTQGKMAVSVSSVEYFDLKTRHSSEPGTT